MLEVIACSVEDAVQADRGGAGRLEIVSHLELGGLTPSLTLVREILAAVSIPVRVMVRENDGYEIQNPGELIDLFEIARELSSLKIDGMVLGFLRNGAVDGEVVPQILACAPNLKATFHRAFDAAENQLQEISTLKRYAQIDRILTNGSDESLERQTSNFKAYEAAARPEIQVLAGGGLDATRIGELITATSVTEFHVGRAVREPPEISGVVRAEKVRQLIMDSRLAKFH